MRTVFSMLLLLLIFTLVACYDCGCDSEMRKVRRKQGWPDRKVTSKTSSGHRIVKWNYDNRWGVRRSYTFEWDHYGGCHCEVTKTTYVGKKTAPEVERWQSDGKGGECALCPSG